MSIWTADWPEEGWMRDESRNGEATQIRADGVVLV